jgi:hypothetical protein
MVQTWRPLGDVTVPSGVLVLAMAGWVDYWPTLGEALSVRAIRSVATGPAHLRDWRCEAIAVPAAPDRPLPVRASTYPSPFGDDPVIEILEVDLGVPISHVTSTAGPLHVGDLPIDRCGTVIGDATALDQWIGLCRKSTSGLADVYYWGRDEDAARQTLGGDPIMGPGRSAVVGWLDIPVSEAKERAAAIRAWKNAVTGRALMLSVEEHTDYHRFQREAWGHPVSAGTVKVAGCDVLGLNWELIDHNMRHEGERTYGAVYPVTILQGDDDGAVMRWTVPRYDADRDG